MIPTPRNFPVALLSGILLAVFLSACGGSSSSGPVAEGKASAAQDQPSPCGIEGTGSKAQGCDSGADQTASGPQLQACVGVTQAATSVFASGDFPADAVLAWNGTQLVTSAAATGQYITLTGQLPGSLTTPGTVDTLTVQSGATILASSQVTVASAHAPVTLAVDPTGRFLYAADTACNGLAGYLSMYTIDSTSGALTAIAPTLDAVTGARAVAVEPGGRFAIVANTGDLDDETGSTSVYSISGATGSLTLQGTVQAPCGSGGAGCAPWSVAVHPSGKYVYVGNEGGFAPTTVTTYRIDPGTGSLSTVDVAVAGARVWGVAADPGGQFVYASVVQYDPADPPPGLSVFSVNPSNGGLMLLGTLTTPGNPAAVVADPVAHFVYATLPDAAEVQMFAVDAAGTLHDLGRVSTGSTPKAAAIDPAGHYLYVANYGSNDVSIYAIDAATGRLTAAGTVAAGLTPSSVTIDPAGRFAYVGNYAVGQISIFSIDAATGALTPAGSAGT